MMTSVIRVKRRIDEDPAESLIVSCKRKKQTESQNVESIFTFAGTITSKNEPVSQQIKEVLKRTQPHSENFKRPTRKTEPTLELRRKNELVSRTNRFRVTCSRRALDLDLLESEEIHSLGHLEEGKDSRSAARKEHSNNKGIDQSSSINPEKATVSSQSSKNKENDSIAKNSPENPSDTNVDLSSASLKDLPTQENAMFCILDIENDDEIVKDSAFESQSGITLNNIPLVSNRVMSPPENERDFVYDLYYAHNPVNDLDLEAVLTVEALCDDLINEERDEMQDREGFNEDSDDSNDENNWRNDYPDEDPNFFENEEVDEYYAEDMVDTNFLHCDDGDKLAFWMGTRCKVDGNSDEDEYKEDDSPHSSCNEN